MPSKATKSGTLKVRVDDPTVKIVERACGYLKVDRSKFVRQCIREKAAAVIEEHERTSFSPDDWKAFFSLMDQPQEPTPRMKRAIEKHREILSQNGL